MEHLPASQQHLRLLQGLLAAPNGSTAVHNLCTQNLQKFKASLAYRVSKKKKEKKRGSGGVGGWGMGGQKAVLETQLSH